MRVPRLAVCLLTVLVVGGCSENGAKGYRVSGEARYDGKPIPYGDVLFTPDGAAGNSGLQGIAIIQDGKYDTSGADGMGVSGGPMVIKVTGLDKPGGKVLCEFEYKADLPKADSKHDIDVPGGIQAAPKRKGPEI